MFKICLENRITHNEEGYQCRICNFENIENKFQKVEEHLKYGEHKRNLKAISIDDKRFILKLETLSETQCRKLVENYIILKKKFSQFQCYICNVTVYGFENVFTHISGPAHNTKFTKNKYVDFKKPVKKCGVNSNFENTVPHKQLLNSNVIQQTNIMSNPVTDNNFDFSCFKTIGFCSLCKIKILDYTGIICHNTLHLHIECSLKNIDIIQFDKSVINCSLCSEVLHDEKSLIEHLNVLCHKQRLDLFKKTNIVMDKENLAKDDEKFNKLEFADAVQIRYICELDDCEVQETNLREHIGGRKHQIGMETNKINFKNKKLSALYMCFLCNEYFPSKNLIFLHYYNHQHKKKIDCFNKIINSEHLKIVQKEVIECNVCHLNTESIEQGLDHLSTKHENMKNLGEHANFIPNKNETNLNSNVPQQIMEFAHSSTNFSENQNNFVEFPNSIPPLMSIQLIPQVSNQNKNTLNVNFNNSQKEIDVTKKSSINQSKNHLNYQNIKENLNKYPEGSKSLLIKDKREDDHILFKSSKSEIDTLSLDENFLQENKITFADKAYNCKICNMRLTYFSDVKFHLQQSFHKAKFEEYKLKNKKCEQMSVSSNANLDSVKLKSFFEIRHCDKCNIHLQDTNSVFYHNMLHLYQNYDLQNNDIIQFEPTFKCLLCNKNLKDQKKFFEHLASDSHFMIVRMFSKLKFNIKDRSFVSNHEEVKIKEYLKPESSLNKTELSISYLCNYCSIPVKKKDIDEHYNDNLHKNNFLSHLKFESSKQQKKKEKIDFFYMCFICNAEFTGKNNLFSHLDTNSHKYRIHMFNKIKSYKYLLINKGKIFCNICNAIMLNIQDCFNHLSGKEHIRNLKIFEEKENQKKIGSETMKGNSFNSEQNNIKLGKTNKGERIEVISKTEKRKESILELNQQSFPVFAANCEQSKNIQDKIKNQEDKIEFLSKTEKDGVFNLNQQNFPSLDLNEQMNKLSLKPTTSTDTKRKFQAPENKSLNTLFDFNLSKKDLKKLVGPKKLKELELADTKNTKPYKIPFGKNLPSCGVPYVKKCLEKSPENIYDEFSKNSEIFSVGILMTFPWESNRECLACVTSFSNDFQSIYEHLFSTEHLDALRNVKENSESFKNFPDQVSDLELFVNYMYEDNGSFIKCFTCNQDVTNDDPMIRAHLISSEHIKNKKTWNQNDKIIINKFNEMNKRIWYFAQFYYCEHCKSKYDFEIDFIEHLQNPNHIKEIQNIKSNGLISKFHFCPACVLYWIGDYNSFDNHCKKDQFHKRFQINKDFMVSPMLKTAVDLLKQVENKIAKLVSNSDKINGQEKENLVLKSVEETISCLYPNAKAIPFGSRISFLGFPDSDLDVFIDRQIIKDVAYSQDESLQFLTTVKECFENRDDVWIVDELIRQTRVPILKLRHLQTGLKCDISFNGLGVHKSNLIRIFNEAFPQCRAMILYLKRWFNLCHLSGVNGLSTFGLSWLVIFFFQIKNIAPSVNSLLEPNNQIIIEGWQCRYRKIVSHNSSTDSNVTELLKEFFKFYADFDYKTCVICPFLGKILKKSAFALSGKLPIEMKIYEELLNKNCIEYFRIDSPLCIQDPIDLSQNITKAVKKLNLRTFIDYCCKSLVEIS